MFRSQGAGASIDSLKALLPTTQGVERVRALRALGWAYRKSDLAQALDYGLQSTDAARSVAQEELPACLNMLGVSYRNIANYPRAMECFFEALQLAIAQRNHREEAYAYNNIGDVYRLQGNYGWSIDNSQKALAIFQRIDDKQGIGYCFMRLGENHESQGRYDEAFKYYEQSLNLRRALHDTLAMCVALVRIGVVHRAQQRYTQALQYFEQALAFMKTQSLTSDVASTMRHIAATYFAMGRYADAVRLGSEALSISQTTQFKLDVQDASEVLWKSYAAQKRYDRAYAYQLLYLAMRDSIVSEQSLKKIATLQINYEVQRKENEIALMQRNERTVRWALMGGLVMSLLLAAVWFNRYRIKRNANREILRQQTILSEQSREIELTNTALQMAVTQADKLLLNVLPAPIAERMKRGETRIAEHFDNAAVLFADLVGFTELSGIVPPQELVDILDSVFSEFDAIAARYGVEKVKTIGDGYMVVAGVPVPLENNIESLAFVAIEMLRGIESFNRARKSHLALRIGLHCGPVVAGVIGKNKFSYDLWGDTVNTASRMESQGAAGKIHCSEDVYTALAGATDSPFAFEERGAIEVKGKGAMRTYFLSEAKAA